jgi:hypothetical protein
MTIDEYNALMERSVKNLRPYEPPAIEQDRDEPDDPFEFRHCSFVAPRARDKSRKLCVAALLTA